MRARNRRGWLQTFSAQCPHCAEVRPLQMRLNAQKARDIWQYLDDENNFDIFGCELQPCTYYAMQTPDEDGVPLVDDRDDLPDFTPAERAPAADPRECRSGHRSDRCDGYRWW